MEKMIKLAGFVVWKMQVRWKTTMQERELSLTDSFDENLVFVESLMLHGHLHPAASGCKMNSWLDQTWLSEQQRKE